MFGKYYQGELTYLRDLGKEFAEVNPSIGALLAERSGDPDVERLLEGFAFLTARVRERIDDAVPEIIQSMCQLLLPHYLRPVPATSIVEFTPQQGALRGRVKLPRGTEVASQPVDGVSCRFQTTADVDLLPLTLQDASMDRSAAAAPVLKISFTTGEGAGPVVFQPAGIRLFLAGEYPAAALLALWLGRHCKTASVRNPVTGAVVRLPPDALSFPGFLPENALFPWPRHAAPGYRLLQEYFTQPAKLLFVDIRGLDRAIDAAGERFEIILEFDRPPDMPGRISRDTFRLACAPVVNLFKTSADPIRYDGTAREHLLRAMDMSPLQMEVHEVVSVVGARGSVGERRRYLPFYDFSHAKDEPPPGAAGLNRGEAVSATPYYALRRVTSPLDGGLDTLIAAVTSRGVLPDEIEDVLSIDLVCTNRSLPARIRTGELSVATPLSPTTARFRNIMPVTPSVRPPLGGELGWRLVSHLALAHRSISDPGLLRGLLGLYNFQALEGHADGQTNDRRMEAIQEAKTRATRRVIEGSPVRGAATHVRVAEGGFAGRGDAFLFGCVLDELLASYLDINDVHELGIRLDPSQAELSWPPRTGQRPIL
jgi:type VI secretion system protein ImpG